MNSSLFLKYSLLVCCLAVCNACGSDSVATTPTPVPVVPACQTNNTASVSFGNTSRATTQDIPWDNLKVFTLAPGQTSGQLTAAAGVAHILRVQITNTTTLACTVSNPIPARCETPVYTCAFP